MVILTFPSDADVLPSLSMLSVSAGRGQGWRRFFIYAVKLNQGAMSITMNNGHS